MGVTIHYRGTMDDVSRIEELEDRVVDLAFSLGGTATIWRSYADQNPSRVIRGVLIDMAVGQETMSLLVSPEGHLINLFEIKAAEKRSFDQPHWCFVKTQYGSMQGHIAIVCLLDALQDGYFSNLEVNDESGYHEHRDPVILSDQRKQLADAMKTMGKGLQEYGLSDEAAEAPEILAARIGRIAQLVWAKIRVPNDLNVDQTDADDIDSGAPTLEEEVVEAERLHRENQLRSERMARRIEEARAQGISPDEAFKLALGDEGLSPPKRDRELIEEPAEDEPWRESLPEYPFAEAEFPETEEPPVLARAESMLTEIMDLAEPGATNNFVNVAIRGLMDLVGGLVQATQGPRIERYERAHAIVQLKRALKGHGFARGAILGLRGCEVITKETSDRMHGELESILTSIHHLLAEVWDESEF